MSQIFETDVSAVLEMSQPTILRGKVFKTHLEPRGTLVAYPGGSYDHRYWCFDAMDGYNAAEYFTERGFNVVAADPLGVGLSDKPDNSDLVTMTSMADAAAAFAQALCADSSITPTGELVGIGHSNGGCITVIAQARHNCYSKIINLGFTHGSKGAVTTDSSGEDVRSVALEQAQAFFEDWENGYCIAPREPSHAWLYNPSVPRELIALDDETLVPWPRQAYVDALTDGFSAPFAAAVASPVLLVFGSDDIPEHPREDARYYTLSNDVTVVVPEDTAHLHNFSTRRRMIWDRMISWASDTTLL